MKMGDYVIYQKKQKPKSTGFGGKFDYKSLLFDEQYSFDHQMQIDEDYWIGIDSLDYFASKGQVRDLFGCRYRQDRQVSLGVNIFQTICMKVKDIILWFLL